MNLFIETLNAWGHPLGAVAGSILLQSSLLILLVWGLDLVLRKKLRASVRYGLWLLVLVKLVLPPSLACPTGLGWWLRSEPVMESRPHRTDVTYTTTETSPAPALAATPVSQKRIEPLPPTLSMAGGALLTWSLISLILLTLLLLRWRQVSRKVRQAQPADPLTVKLLAEAQALATLRREVELRFTIEPISPAVCGILKPIVMLPRDLTEHLSPNQLRAVLLHEIIHLRRGDLWVNLAQTMLQIVFWWHPLLWFANHRLRDVREEAVDDAVMIALADQAEDYAPTLLAVARQAFSRPMATLALIGILESRSALRRRIERLVTFQKPSKAGVTLLSVVGLAVFGAVAVPMGEAPVSSPPTKPMSATPTNSPAAKATPVSLPISDAHQLFVALQNIHLANVSFKNRPLSEVLSQLNDESKKQDTEGKGISFTIKTNKLGWIPVLETLPITINPPLTNTSLLDALGAICEGSPCDIHYTILDSQIEFSLDKNPKEALFSKTFPIKSPKFFPNLNRKASLPEGGETGSALGALGTMIDGNWSPTSHEAPLLRVELTNNSISVRGSLQNLAVADRVINELNQETFSQTNTIVLPLQPVSTISTTNAAIRNRAKIRFISQFIELPNFDPKKEAISPLRVLLTKETSNTPSREIAVTPELRTRYHLPEPLLVSAVSEGSLDSNLLTKEETMALLEELSHRTLDRTFAAAQTNLVLEGALGNFSLKSASTVVGAVGEETNKVYVPINIMSGSEFHYVAKVEEDGRVTLNVDTSIVEFCGYDKPKKDDVIKMQKDGKTFTVLHPLPRLKLRQTTTTATVKEGQSLVLGGLLSEEITKVKDKVPVLGDIPLLGRLFRSESSTTTKKNLYLLITPTVEK